MGGSVDAIGTRLLSIIGKSAPLLASALGSPFAGMAISLLCGAFGVDKSKLDEAITADPEASLKLKTLEYEHAEALAKIASSDYGLEVDDRKDARQTAVLYKDFLRHLAYLVTAGFFCALLLLFVPINLNDNERELLSMLIGMLSSKWQTIIDFFYGSSHRRESQK